MEDSPTGFAGFIKREYLESTLSWLIFDSNQEVDKLDLTAHSSIDTETVKGLINITLDRCFSLLAPREDLYVHIFPTWSVFVKEEMNSVSGFTPYKNTLLLFVEGNEIQVEAFVQTISHEYLHAQQYNYLELENLRDALVFEGLAEHFSELVTGKRSKFSQSLNKEEVDNFWEKLTPLLGSTELDLQREVFTYGDKYPLWGGYALGYELVDEYIKKNPNVQWMELVALDPEQIVK